MVFGEMALWRNDFSFITQRISSSAPFPGLYITPSGKEQKALGVKGPSFFMFLFTLLLLLCFVVGGRAPRRRSLLIGQMLLGVIVSIATTYTGISTEDVSFVCCCLSVLVCR